MKWAEDLFPFARSLTGDGNRKTLKYIKNINSKFLIKAFKSNEKVFDWKIPEEWKINEAYFKDYKGKKYANFKKNNLYVLNYSQPINKKISLKNLRKNIFTLKNKPKSIPYVTSYYKKRWGFCLDYNTFKNLKDSNYLAYIDSKLFKGKMNYAELKIKGKSKKEILLCSYICHPSMANNELSGPLVLLALSKILKPSKYTVRIILIPETIGAISYINKNIMHLKKNLVAGFNLSCVGDNGPFTLISSIEENTYADKVAVRVMQNRKKFKKLSFLYRGSNERQFGCQNLNLPFVTICRTRFGDYKEYHTSDDNLSVISGNSLFDSMKCVLEIVNEIQKNNIYIKKTICEPFLTRHNLAETAKFVKFKKKKEINIRNIISYVGKNYDLIDISKKLKIPFNELNLLIKKIEKKKVIKKYL
jgi:aminopeptidase-like protein